MTIDLFGEATPPTSAEPRVWSVTELTRVVRSTLEDEIGAIWVEGEVSNYRRQPSGHQYFTLKDAQAQISCVWFARGGLRLKQTTLADGVQVQIRGALTVYEARGQYQLNVQIVQAAGAGLLQAKFDALKRKLEAEGLFDAGRKRQLPAFPTKIGVVTSATGAALRDILNVLARRAPWVRVIVHPVRVQGEGAAQEIAAAVAEFGRWAGTSSMGVDVVLVARGGGSIEDLWAFNEEIVARAIAASPLPIVSAVGHEIDFTIADFVADLRAPTPSAAAELLVPDGLALRQHLDRYRLQLPRMLDRRLLRCRDHLLFLTRSALFQEPRKRLAAAAQRLDLQIDELREVLRQRLENAAQRCARPANFLRQHRPDRVVALRRLELEARRRRLVESFTQKIREQRSRWQRLHQALQHLSPEALLARGFSVTTTSDGKIVTSIAQVPLGTSIVTRLRDGTVKSIVQ